MIYFHSLFAFVFRTQRDRKGEREKCTHKIHPKSLHLTNQLVVKYTTTATTTTTHILFVIRSFVDDIPLFFAFALSTSQSLPLLVFVGLAFSKIIFIIVADITLIPIHFAWCIKMNIPIELILPSICNGGSSFVMWSVRVFFPWWTDWKCSKGLAEWT